VQQSEIARVVAGTLDGLAGLRVQVEVDLARSLPGFHLVGLPGTAIRESRERVGAALRHAGFRWPDRRITVSLAPADLPKEGAGMDLAIAAGILFASGQVSTTSSALLGKTLLVGELALDGSLRPVRGLLALALDAKRLGIDRLIVPFEQVPEVDAAHSTRRIGLRHLAELPEAVDALDRLQPSSVSIPVHDESGERDALAFAQVKGQEEAKRALTLAAAGGHHLLMIGPPGCGKTMLAHRLCSLLPSLSGEQRAERLRVESCAGLAIDLARASRPPFRAPHHTVTGAGLTGGGRPPRPGEVTLAHRGVLFLDEAAEFEGSVLDRLREPLVTGEVRLARLGRSTSFPAAFQLIAATNPCPCGWYGSRVKECACRPARVDRYLRRLSGPLRDRIELWTVLDREPAEHWWEEPDDPREEEIRRRICAARERALSRGSLNAALDGDALKDACRLDENSRLWLQSWADRMNLSLRALAGTMRVARTVADLQERAQVIQEDLAVALAFRPPA
jgi:magnesium chelatase family protein